MTSNKLFAFFTKSLNNTSFDTHREAWVDAIREVRKDPGAEVVLVKHTEWNAPILKSIEASEIRKIGIMGFGMAMKPVLEKHGVPQVVIQSCMTNISVIPFPNAQMICYVFTYTPEWQERAKALGQ